MTRGFYSATSAMMADMDRFETVANNLANINTHGFKRHQTLHQDFQQGFINRIKTTRPELNVNSQGDLEREFVSDRPRNVGELGTGTFITSTWTHFGEGTLQETQGPLDFGLKGEGFFTIANPAGEARYTRNGHFQLNNEGVLVTSDGLAVMGENGPIQLESAAKLTIDQQGRVFADGQEVDQLKIVNFEQPQLLLNEGGNRFSALPGQQAQNSETAQVSQGFLEQSNVDAATEMVQMISALRSYQISQKALQTEDEMSGRLINDVGRV